MRSAHRNRRIERLGVRWQQGWWGVSCLCPLARLPAVYTRASQGALGVLVYAVGHGLASETEEGQAPAVPTFTMA